MEYPFVSVIVGVRNEENYVAECIESLLNQDYPKNLYEIIIVDGMSTDSTQNIVQKYPIKLIINERMNVAAARNLGVKEAKGDYVAFTDGDCKADTQWLRNLIDEMLNAPENVACVGGPNLIFDSDPIFAKAVGYAQETFLGSGGSAQSSNSLKKKYVQSLPNCNAMYKKYVIEDAGFFDEYFKIGQDGELNYRISKNNYLFLYVPEAVVWHHRRGSFKTFSVRMFKYGKWMGKLFEKHRKLIRWYAILPSIAMVYALFSLIVYVKYPVFIYILQFLIFIYILLLLYATYTVILNMKSVKGIAAIVILPTQHIMYGLGFLSNLFKLGLR